ncbi:Fasciclin domain-containing protein [Filimonas lacunae]|uniref:Fasciclin domain-containing protein n=1 Tax=Filimonas lacunae TaxID=477680 RepID=A0A173MAK0_9BACT|nr:fasciclin domain-containing protein [Filimonas lacunae]BAV04557.1 transforming growth factor-beta induced protein IG-H3 precursor [Filimonas lacunae]SIT34766.1 Fasciclin domain-containing protein [Filimonas lacunae]
MKKMITLAVIAITMLVIISVQSCKKTDLVESTTTDVNILAYLKQFPDQFSSLVNIIDKVGYSDFLNAYGTYTLFAPTNAAVKTWLQQKGKGSIDQMDADELKGLLKLHLLEEVVNTSNFTDGKLPAATMYGQYLITGVANKEGSSSYIVNRQAYITQPNITTGNGVIQVIDGVLTPAQYSVAQLLEQDASFSIFLQAVKETGYYDTLNVVQQGDVRKWYTLIAENNQALADSGYSSYAALKARYCNTGDPKNAVDSLHLFVAYHILPDIKYLADIVMAGSHETLAPLEVITDKVVNQQVLLNDDEFNGEHEQGVLIDQASSDVSATNGVLHRATAHLPMKLRSPFPVYWDLAQFPELTRLAAYYRKANYVFEYGSDIADVKWEKGSLTYQNGKSGFLGDYLQIQLGTSSSGSWIEFTTPLLVKGKYKVWFCYRQEASGGDKNVTCQVSFDSVPLTSALVQFHVKNSTVDAAKDAEQEALGWKCYMVPAAGFAVGRMVGIVDVKVTGRHKLKLSVAAGSNGTNDMDMVHFIPVGANQIYPRFKTDGTLVTTP